LRATKDQKINLRGIFFKKYFPKEFKKNALDLIGLPFEDESIKIDIVPQLKKILDFSRGITPFCKNKGSQRLDSCWNFLNLKSARVQTILEVKI